MLSEALLSRVVVGSCRVDLRLNPAEIGRTPGLEEGGGSRGFSTQQLGESHVEMRRHLISRVRQQGGRVGCLGYRAREWARNSSLRDSDHIGSLGPHRY